MSKINSLIYKEFIPCLEKVRKNEQRMSEKRRDARGASGDKILTLARSQA